MTRALAIAAAVAASGCGATHLLGEAHPAVQGCVDATSPCPTGAVCVDDPTDACDPATGGAACPGVCQTVPMGPGWTCADLPPQGVTCGAECGGGYLVEAGKVTCGCCGSTGCPTIKCENVCPYGRTWDLNGCLTCECKQSPPCMPVSCDNTCAFGRKLDDTGCETCACIEPTCVTTPPTDVQCFTPCGTYALDNAGKPTCQCCEPVTCQPVVCDVSCPNGLAIDANGCEICECAPVLVDDSACARTAGTCNTDADCKVGGCLGELCYNPTTSSGSTPCNCTDSVVQATCGCVAGKCRWFDEPATN